MRGEDLDAAIAGYRMGYGDSAHFNREYKRLLSMPPMRDMGRLQGSCQSQYERLKTHGVVRRFLCDR